MLTLTNMIICYRGGYKEKNYAHNPQKALAKREAHKAAVTAVAPVAKTAKPTKK